MTKAAFALLALLVLPGLTGVQDDFAAAEKEFKSALRAQTAKPLEDAIKSLVRINTPAAAKLILQSIKVGHDSSIYWMLVNGAATFGSPEALAELTKLILSNKSSPISRDLVAALHGNHTSGCETALITILREGSVDLQVLAVEHMMDVGQKATVEAAIEVLRKGAGSAELTRRLFRVLNVLCIETYGETLSNWEGWWNANKHKDWSQLKAKPQGSGGGTGTVVDDLGKHRDAEYEKLKTGKVLVIGAKKGCKCKDPHDLDTIESIVERMRLTVEYVNKIDFDKAAWTSAKLDEYVAILCNCMFIEEHCVCNKCQQKAGGSSGNRMRQCPPDCGCGHKTAKYLMAPAGLDKIRKYVDAGGYLFTEDWGLREILSVKFKEFVDVGEFIRSDMEVNIYPKPGASSHPYLRNIFSRLKPRKKGSSSGGTVAEGPDSPDFERIDHTWQIDKDSPVIKITGGSKVTTLIFSKDVARAAKGSDAVAITFVVAPKSGGGLDPVATGAPIEQDRTKMSGGRVLHVMSHFGKQKNQSDEFTIQNLLLNFLIEASERKGIKVEKK